MKVSSEQCTATYVQAKHPNAANIHAKPVKHICKSQTETEILIAENHKPRQLTKMAPMAKNGGREP